MSITPREAIPVDKNLAITQLWNKAGEARNRLEVIEAWIVDAKKVVKPAAAVALEEDEPMTVSSPLVFNPTSNHLDLNVPGINHSDLGNLLEDVHTQYVLVAGTRAFTGDQAMGTHKLTGLAVPTVAGDAIRQTTTITEVNLTDLTDTGDTTLHKHDIYVLADGTRAMTDALTINKAVDNANFSSLILKNTDNPLTTEVGQSVSIDAYLRQYKDGSGVYSDELAARIVFGKTADFYNAALLEGDDDSNIQFWVDEGGTLTKALMLDHDLSATFYGALNVTGTTTLAAGLSGLALLTAGVVAASTLLGWTALTDPGADRIAFWDDSESAMKWLTVSTGLDVSAANLTCTITQYTDALARAAISTTVTGLTYTAATGVLSLTAGYVIPTTTQETDWGTAYTKSHARAHNLLTVGDHADVATYLDQALLVASAPQFARLGIGAAADATHPLIIAKAASNWAVQLDSYSDTDTEYGEIDFRRSGSDTLGVLAATGDVFYFGRFAFQGVNAAGTPARKTAAAIYGIQVGAAGAVYVGGKIRFDTGTNAAAPAERMTIGDTGQITIGAPDSADAVPLLRVWKATAGAVDSVAGTLAVFENNDDAFAAFLTPNNKSWGILGGDPEADHISSLIYSNTTNVWTLKANATDILTVSDSTITAQKDVDNAEFNALYLRNSNDPADTEIGQSVSIRSYIRSTDDALSFHDELIGQILFAKVTDYFQDAVRHSKMILSINDAGSLSDILTIAEDGINVLGKVTCDLFRLDVAPTTGLTADQHVGFACTAKIMMNFNGANYYVPCEAV